MEQHPLMALSERYLLEKTCSQATKKAYRIAFQAFTRYLQQHKIEFASTSDVIRYRDERRLRGDSSVYLHVHVSALRGLYTYLKQNQRRLGLPEVYQHDIMAPIKNERLRARLHKPILSLPEARHLLRHTKEHRRYLSDYRDHAIVYLMLVAGLRGIEIVRARRTDYQGRHDHQVLLVPARRTGDEQTVVHITGGLKEALDDYLSRRHDDNPHLFISHKKVSKSGQLSRTFLRDMFARILRDCGLEDTGVTPHSLRHTAAILNLERGGTIEQTRSLLRHVDLQSTMVYVDYLEQMNDDSAQAIERFLVQESSFVPVEGELVVQLVDGPRFVFCRHVPGMIGQTGRVT
jgi:integrase